MIKRILPFLAVLTLALAVVVPSAFAEDGSGAGAQPTRTQRGEKGNAGKEKLRKAVEQARKACSDKAHKQQCAKAAKRILGALKQAEQRVQKLQEKLAQAVEQRCGAAASGDAARCEKLRRRLERLSTLETKLHAAIEKLDSRIGKAGENTGTSSPDAPVSDAEIESVEELAAELADSGN